MAVVAGTEAELRELGQPVRVMTSRPVDESGILAEPLRRDCALSHGRGQPARTPVNGHAVEEHDVARFRHPADEFAAVAVGAVEVGNAHGVVGLRRSRPSQPWLLEVRLCQGTFPPARAGLIVAKCRFRLPVRGLASRRVESMLGIWRDWPALRR